MTMHGGAFNYDNAPVKIRKESSYRGKLREAESSQAAMNNAYIFGAQAVTDAGVGAQTKASRHPLYANPNRPIAVGIGGIQNNFSQQSHPGSMPLSDYANQTGFGPELGTSATIDPGQDPRAIAQNAKMRIEMMAQGRQFQGYNNRANTYNA